MKQFEFKLVTQPTYSDQVVELLNKLGAEGWMLAAKDYGCFIMQREIVFEAGGMNMRLGVPVLERPGISELLNS
jgi:hypothetical protein